MKPANRLERHRLEREKGQRRAVPRVRLGEVTDTTPLMVSVGGAGDVPAVALSDATISVSDVVVLLEVQGSPPIVLGTTTTTP